ncbi:MAG: hypothetical protein MZU97_18930 [Bacillus subtilis]|nr:hypothetical protein [Bacillus subtilis]
MKRSALFILLALAVAPALLAYPVYFKEQYYRLFHTHYIQYPDDSIENIYWLEQAREADFCNPLYALAKIEYGATVGTVPLPLEHAPGAQADRAAPGPGHPSSTSGSPTSTTPPGRTRTSRASRSRRPRTRPRWRIGPPPSDWARKAEALPVRPPAGGAVLGGRSLPHRKRGPGLFGHHRGRTGQDRQGAGPPSSPCNLPTETGPRAGSLSGALPDLGAIDSPLPPERIPSSAALALRDQKTVPPPNPAEAPSVNLSLEPLERSASVSEESGLSFSGRLP